MCQSQRDGVCCSRKQLEHSKENLSWGWMLPRKQTQVVVQKSGEELGDVEEH